MWMARTKSVTKPDKKTNNPQLILKKLQIYAFCPFVKKQSGQDTHYQSKLYYVFEIFQEARHLCSV